MIDQQLILDVMSSSKYQASTLEQLHGYFPQVDLVEFKKLVKALVEAGEIMLDDSKRFILISQAGLVKGILRMNPKGFGFVENEEVSIFCHSKYYNGALDGDEVIVEVVKDRNDKNEAKVVKIVNHNLKTLVGIIKVRNSRKQFSADSQKFDQSIKITNMQTSKVVNDSKVLVKITQYTPKLEGEIVKVLGHKNDPGVDISAILLENDIVTEFPKEVFTQIEQIQEEISAEELAKRYDLRDELIVTIDGDDAKDLDDAISVKRKGKNYELDVHIADVSHYVTKNSPLDYEAYERGTSVYVVDRVVPMLPHFLSNGVCSLNPLVDRLSVSCKMEINPQGEVVDYKIFPSVIHSKARMTYRRVNEILEGKALASDEDSFTHEMLHVAQELAHILRKRRDKLGALDFDKKEGKVVVNKYGKPVDVVVRERYEAERLIEDMMIAANECVASHMKWNDLPSMYRIHQTPEPKKMRDFALIAKVLGFPLKGNVQDIKPVQLQKLLREAKNSENHEVLAIMMLRAMQKAVYDDKCLGHFGLGLKEYTHFTSPIRRYPDLVVHRMLHKYVFEDNYNAEMMSKDTNWIVDAAKQSSIRERIAIDAEREVDDMKKAEYMEQYVGYQFHGIISSVTKFGFFVELPNTVEGLVHITNLKDDFYEYRDDLKLLEGKAHKNVYKIGQKVKVKVIKASKLQRQVDFEVIESKKHRVKVFRSEKPKRHRHR